MEKFLSCCETDLLPENWSELDEKIVTMEGAGILEIGLSEADFPRGLRAGEFKLFPDRYARLTVSDNGVITYSIFRFYKEAVASVW